MSTPIKDLKNKKIGSLEPLKTEKINGKTMWLCKCDCGNYCHYFGYNLIKLEKKGNFPTCGCSHINYEGKIRTIVGIKTALIQVVSYEKEKNLYYCINKDNKSEYLKSTAIKLRISRSKDYEHRVFEKNKFANQYGYKNISEYNKASIKLHHILIMMKERCYNKDCKQYTYYGGRGINISCEWLQNSKNFVHWAMQNGYKQNLEIDRIDVNGNYEPNNCRWVTRIDNMNNTRKNFYISIDGETRSLSDWCRKFGLNYKKTHSLIKYKNKLLEDIIKESRC